MIPKGTRAIFRHEPVPLGDDYFDFFLSTRKTLIDGIPLDESEVFVKDMKPANPVTNPQHIPKFIEGLLMNQGIGEVYCQKPFLELGVGKPSRCLPALC